MPPSSPVRARRGLVGSTNLSARPRDCATGQPVAVRSPLHKTPHPDKASSAYDASPRGDMGQKRRPAGESAGTRAGRDGRQLGVGSTGAQEGGAAGNSRHVRRDKFRLPLVSAASSPGISIASTAAPEQSAEAQLARNINEHERRSKAFKDESWYKSPIGSGSKKAVLLVALQQRDPAATGQIRRDDVEQALAGAIFGLQPHHVRDLLAGCAADKDAPVDYRRLVNSLKLPQEQPEQDPLIYRQQSYIDKIRARSQVLLQQATVQPVVDGSDDSFTDEWKLQPPSSQLPLVSPVQVAVSGPHRDAVKGCTGRDRDSVVGSAASIASVLPPLISPLRANPEPLSPDRDPEVDRLSFEYDKQRKQRRADAKTRTLLAHINRVDEYSRRQQQAAENHDNLRLAAKAAHRQEHFERAFDEENRVLRVKLKQGKGGLRSEYSLEHRNVSKDSMFNVDPARPTHEHQ